MKHELREDVISSRREFSRRYWNLPMRSKNAAQKALLAKHGTPFDFAKACAAAIGEISVEEAEKAVAKYLKEWKAAK